MSSSREAISPLGLHLTFAAGKGIAALRGRRLGAVEVERLDLEIPRLVFPFDISGGIGRFQSRRCVVRAASFSLSEEALAREVARLFPDAALSLRVREGYLSVAGRFVWHATEAIDLTARLYLDIAYGRMALALLDDLRLYGLSSVPAPLIARALLGGLMALVPLGASGRSAPSAQRIDSDASLGAAPPKGAKAQREALRLLGATAAEVDPLRMLVAAYLPRLGWKIPDVREVRLEEIKVSGGKLSFSYSAAESAVRPPSPSRAVLQAREALRLFSAAEEALLGGKLDEALARFRREVERVGHHPLLDLRIGEILAADAERAAQAQVHLTAALARHPGGTYAPRLRALLAQAHLRAGQTEEARLQLEALADAAEAGGDPEEALWAGLWLARSAEHADLAPVIARLERLAQQQKGHRPTVETLADLYERAGRYEDLALLWREMSAAEEDPLQAAQLRVRLGDLYRLRLQDAKRARTQYERALSRDPRCFGAWRGLAEILLWEGDTRAALVALDEALALAPDDSIRAEIHLRAGTIWEDVLEDLESAALRYGESLALAPGSPQALSRMATLHTRRGRFSQAAACYEELARSRALDHAARAQALLSLATLLEESLGDPDEAYACVRRALELTPDNREARAMRERLASRLASARAPQSPRSPSSRQASPTTTPLSPRTAEPARLPQGAPWPDEEEALVSTPPPPGQPEGAPQAVEQEREERAPRTALLLARAGEPPAATRPAASEQETETSARATALPEKNSSGALFREDERIDDSTLDALVDLALSEDVLETPLPAAPAGKATPQNEEQPPVDAPAAPLVNASPTRSAPVIKVHPGRSLVVPLDDEERLAHARKEAQAEGREDIALYYGALLAFLGAEEPAPVYAPPPEALEPHPGALLPPRELFLALAPTLGPLVGALSPEVEQGPQEIAQELFSLAAAVDAPPFMLRWVAGDGVRVVLGEPPAIEIGAEINCPPKERRFLLARAIAQVRFAAPLAEKLSPQELEEVVFLMAAACDPVTVVADEGALSEGMRAQVEALLEQTPHARRQELLPAVSQLLDAYGVVDFAEFRRGMLATCDREALLGAQDLAVALTVLAREAGQEPKEALRQGPCRDLALFAAEVCGAEVE